MNIMKKIIHLFNTTVPAVRNIVIVATIVLIAIFINNVKNKNILDEFIKENMKHEQDAKLALAINDSLNIDIAKNQKSAEDAHKKIILLENRIKSTQENILRDNRKVDSLKIVLKDTSHTMRDSIDILIDIVPKQDTIIMQKDIVIALRETQIQLQEKIVLQQDSSIKKLLIANDTLSKIVASTPTLKKNPNKLFGFIPLPSRRTALVVGFIGGVITTAGIAR